MNTQGKKINFGRYQGELFTRIPIGYLKWLVNEKTEIMDIAEAELERRGVCTPAELELSVHSIDRASQKCWDIYQRTKQNNEGLYSWLYRVALEALRQLKTNHDCVNYLNMRFVFSKGGIYHTLTTIMKSNEKKNRF